MKHHGRGLPALSILTVVAIVGAFSMAAFYAPQEAEGPIQRIFYLHAPMAIVALGGFVAGGVFGLLHLRTRRRVWDLRSYVAIHMSLILGVGVLLTGAIWGKGQWGTWWSWDEPMLVSFLIIFLLYATYQPMRFSIEDPERQSRYASVFAVVAGAYVPINFAAVRLATDFLHPKTFASADGGMPGEMLLTFLVALVAMTLLFVTLCRYEIAAKRTRGQLSALRRRLSNQAPLVTGRSAAPKVEV